MLKSIVSTTYHKFSHHYYCTKRRKHELTVIQSRLKKQAPLNSLSTSQIADIKQFWGSFTNVHNEFFEFYYDRTGMEDCRFIPDEI